MSLGIVMKGPEGLVLAAESRMILTTQQLYLTANDIVEIHLGLAQDFARAGKPFEVGTLSPEKLEVAVAPPRQSSGGVELYSDLFMKAAVLARGIIRGHVFVDGNKRTGMESALLFPEYNGWSVNLPTGEYVSLALAIVGDRARGVEAISLHEIADRLRAFSTQQPA